MSCPICGKKSPDGYITCASSECQEESYKQQKERNNKKRRKKIEKTVDKFT